ncbi:NAD(P)-dependent oxidoreductase [Campylobacter coli]|nr:NAD(P)-dependent oxidoreductase [Campylobacter coli]CDG56944.1 NAD-dependent epimerase/dehydratase [Campylobacter coli 76339]HEB7534392.1 NAD(P)-dependent oxidoreductase [Campylobacter coli]HEB7549245.1 NAD(P)-dependent oxidoreductase [Campylobacter coli]
MNKNVLVFGGGGFIGSYVVEELLANNYNVLYADINSCDSISMQHYRKCDIMQRKDVESLCQDMDIVFNFAGFANLDDAIANPLKTLELNVMGNMHILEGCRKCKIKRYIYASSAYAMSDKGSFYGISKLTSEKLIEEYFKKFGLKFTIIRYGSVYGEREYYNNYIYNLVKEAMLKGKISHGGDGEEIREYIHAYDVAKLALQIIENSEFENEYLILTGTERMQRKELFEMINEMLGGKIEISIKVSDYHNHYKTTPYSFHPTRSKKLVANPHIDMGQGILECMKNIEKKYL